MKELKITIPTIKLTAEQRDYIAAICWVCLALLLGNCTAKTLEALHFVDILLGITSIVVLARGLWYAVDGDRI